MSVYATLPRGYEIMFHVSTLMPFNKNDRQQLERKRHIGNDIVTIVFTEGSTPFSMKTISSHFLHIFAVVRRETAADGKTMYRVHVGSNTKVPAFGPALPSPPLFTHADIREFLLIKLINGETSTYTSETFQQRSVRTLTNILKYIHEKFYESGTRSNPNKRMNMVPQTLRLDGASALAALANDMSMYDVSTVISDLPHVLQCCTRGCGGALVIGTDYGLYSFSPATAELVELPTSKRRSYVRVVALEEIDSLVVCGARKGGKNHVFSYRLSEALRLPGQSGGRGRGTLKGTKLTDARMAHDMAAAPIAGKSAVLVVAVRRSVLVYQ
eukprot:Opistho-2@56327